jgi:DNA-binding Lrp family transcriptional regulator
MTTGAVQKKPKIDKIDCKILADLQTNGRMTNVELANRAGISAPPCLRRIRNLEDQGIIKGYFSNLDAKKLGFGVTAFVTVRLKEQNDEDMIAFEAEIMKNNKIREAYVISGDYDYMLRVVAHDWEEYQIFLSEKLTRMKNVSSVRSSMQVKTAKYEPGVPINMNEF